MIGTRRRLRASSVSAGILRGALRYATFMGVISFGVKWNRSQRRLVAKDWLWYKWFCLLTRVLMCGLNFVLYYDFIFVLNMSHLKVIVIFRMLICMVCAAVTLLLQFWHGQRVLRVVNSFLRLYQRVEALPGCRDVGFGGRWALCLLLGKVICMLHELVCMIPPMLEELEFYFVLSTICDTYNTVNAAIILNTCFVGYLSLGIIYDRLNGYVRHELRQQLGELGDAASRMQLEAAGQRLDECLAIYDELHQVGRSFHQLIELPLCIILMFGFVSMALVALFIMLNLFDGISLWVMEVKMLLDILLLTLVVHGASSSSRVIRRLSLENYYVSEHKDWHRKLEMFLNRLNYNEFPVRPLGLFEVSNELILVFLSGLVTYLTYILQYSRQWENL
ncbi:putative gustatory receptor 93c [Drosophila novamexicana]|uniref:putative gustatory receptor 93c n=1 Tax=Drosophila novamexicana TaxID=47314 RepID=UPI0011E5A0E5|nr:putative gustatory receptor 93c [Drosophila novamexicana]